MTSEKLQTGLVWTWLGISAPHNPALNHHYTLLALQCPLLADTVSYQCVIVITIVAYAWWPLVVVTVPCQCVIVIAIVVCVWWPLLVRVSVPCQCVIVIVIVACVLWSLLVVTGVVVNVPSQCPVECNDTQHLTCPVTRTHVSTPLWFVDTG